jgi:hypothetical protein
MAECWMRPLDARDGLTDAGGDRLARPFALLAQEAAGAAAEADRLGQLLGERLRSARAWSARWGS